MNLVQVVDQRNWLLKGKQDWWWKVFLLLVMYKRKVFSSFEISCVDLWDCFPTLGTCSFLVVCALYNVGASHRFRRQYVKFWKLSDILAFCIVKTKFHWKTWPHYYKVSIIITCHHVLFISLDISHTSCHNVTLLLRSFFSTADGISQTQWVSMRIEKCILLAGHSGVSKNYPFM
jgi:hypothetical protein